MSASPWVLPNFDDGSGGGVVGELSPDKHPSKSYIATGLSDNQFLTIFLIILGSFFLVGIIVGILVSNHMLRTNKRYSKKILLEGLWMGALSALLVGFFVGGISIFITGAVTSGNQQSAIVDASLQSWANKTYDMNLNKQAAHDLAYEVNSGGPGGKIVAVYDGKPIEVKLTKITGTNDYVLMDNKTKEALPIDLSR